MTYVQLETKDGKKYDSPIWEVNFKKRYIVIGGESMILISFEKIKDINHPRIRDAIHEANRIS